MEMDLKVYAKENPRKKKILEYIINETTVKTGSELIWLWVANNQKIEKFFLFIYQKNETRLLLKSDFCQTLKVKVNLGCIRFLQTVAHGVRKPVVS
jgi:hypothetical protein